MRVQRGDQHQRFPQIFIYFLPVRANPLRAVSAEGVAGIRQQVHRLQEIVNHHRHEHIQLKIPLRRRQPDGRVVTHDLNADHGHRFALRGIDLSGHDGTAGLILRNRELADSASGS